MKMYQISHDGIFTGVTADVDPLQGTPTGWVNTEPPALAEGEAAQWSGRWAVTMAVAIPGPSLTELRSVAVKSNNAKYEAAIGQLTRDYPAAEITTWERQRAEAVAWGADPDAATPWIDIAASARGLARGEYLARTLAKVTAFAGASAYLTGRRQGIDDQIRAATTAEELAAVVIDYTLPGA